VSHITLLPKVDGPRSVSEYRPISLLNTSIKIITKLLANRLQRVILDLIHKNQYGFIKGRTIQDCLAWSFEYLHLYDKSRKELIILKLDFEKAFDKIEHQAMLEIMRHKGFDDIWMRWMKSIFTSGTSSILLNGVPGKTFHCRRGERQGDPLSPLVFVLAADLLQSLLNKATQDDLLKLPIPLLHSSDFPVI
jgi:retron-type reverse transcriptase